MNKYRKWYQNLIDKAKNRTEVIGYSENHHILPKCMGGTNDSSNIVTLTGREHFIAHLLLARMNLSKKHHIQMLHAANAMANKYTQIPDKREYNSRLYESLKIELNEHLSNLWKGDENPTRKMTGEKKEQWKEKLRNISIEKMKDPVFYSYYKEQQKIAVTKPENREKVSKKTKEAMARPEVRERFLIGYKNRKIDKEYHKKRVKEAMERPEVMEKIQEFRSIKRKWCTNGEKNKLIPVDQSIPDGWRLGMYRTEEDIKKITERLVNSNKNRTPWNKGKKGLQKMNIETRNKMSESQKKRWQEKNISK